MKSRVTKVQHQNTKNQTVILIFPISCTYLLICLLDILVKTSCLSEHVHTYTYVVPARYSTIRDIHVMVPTSAPRVHQTMAPTSLLTWQ